MSYQTGPRIVTNGLVFCVDAADTNSYPGSGTTWNDLSGNGNNGTLTNGPTFTSANRGSIVFDGTDDYVICGSGSVYNLGNNFTLNSWVYPAEIGDPLGDQIVSLATTSNAPYIAYGLEWIDDYKYFSAYIGNTSNQIVSCETNNTFSINQWYNVVETYDGSSIKIYVNGILENSTASVSTVLYGTNILTIGIGYYNITFTKALKGRISNISLYNRALSATEVAQNYNAIKGRYNL